MNNYLQFSEAGRGKFAFTSKWRQLRPLSPGPRAALFPHPAKIRIPCAKILGKTRRNFPLNAEKSSVSSLFLQIIPLKTFLSAAMNSIIKYRYLNTDIPLLHLKNPPLF
ncbi:MAG TPA: hypothetical protein IAB02_00815 [Candidatus Pullichristensenella excrementigallinarum]|uniref:Uncharacterized protein n=1 Tax=Candidatus Pullichristensenella excrementigallinarum TaxID=2840907 RepID=A0A9D1I9Y2_9FIRM|nr:hypothetical protein [Candidatus Pullichristensenella excrementigallinarum]